MATQSLYRRYRPRRFSEVKGQQHVVKALRDAVASGREGQAYLFSGPRGTGKTTSARILAKALNCENVSGGEPCCECASCLAVENGTSYDVHELDATSNNGVDAIRDLIEKASLGTPGRHKVYILDEVHMLSKGAEAALLKTLEEPPPHVVFVLATTDPQKMSDTIRSRTQHLQFHLLPADELAEHVRWVANDAGLDLTDEAFDAALARGGGSARDTLSALELLVATGGEVGDTADLDGLMSALIDHDPGAALTAMAAAVSMGLDPRAITEDLVRHLRNGFLSLMAPELVVMAPERLDALTERARALGAPAIVRAIERLGTALTDMRNAPDPRVLVEVALVQLTQPSVSGDIGAFEARLAALERGATASGGGAAPAAVPTGDESTASDAQQSRTTDSAERNPKTGRKVLGSAAQQAKEAAQRARENARRQPGRSTRPAETTPVQPAEPTPAAPTQPAPSEPSPARAAAAAPVDDTTPASAPPTSNPRPAPTGASAAAPEPGAAGTASATAIERAWGEVRGSLPPMAHALYSGAELSATDGLATFAVGNDAQLGRCNEHRGAVEAALASAAGAPVSVEVTLAGPGSTTGSSAPSSGGNHEPAASPSVDDDEADIDLTELTDVPPDEVKSPMDQLAEAFPGSEIVEE